VELTSIVLKVSLKSEISQIFKDLSFPPVAKYFPFGEIATAFTLDS